MTTYRVFVQDRPGGMYSAYKQVCALNPELAIRKFEQVGTVGSLLKFHAVEWPAKSAADNQWLDEYVNGAVKR